MAPQVQKGELEPRILPQELVDAIIDHLHTDSATLRNCTFVSKSFFYPARYHLHHDVLVDYVFFDGERGRTSPERADATKFALDIDKFPQIGVFIRHLTIQPFSGAGCVDVDTHHFLRTVKKLSNLRVLVLRFLTFSKVEGPYQQTNGDALSSNDDAKLNLEAMEVELVNFQNLITFNAILALFDRIDALDIERCFSQYLTPHTCEEQIESLGSTSSIIRTSKLKLRLRSGCGDPYLLRVLRHHLQVPKSGFDLRIRMCEGKYGVLSVPESGDFPSFMKYYENDIRSFTLDFKTYFRSEGEEDLVPTLETLRRIPITDCPHLESLTLVLRSRFWEGNCGEWKGNLNILTSSAKSLSIRRIRVEMFYLPEPPFNQPSSQSDIQSTDDTSDLESPTTTTNNESDTQKFMDSKLRSLDWYSFDQVLSTFRNLDSIDLVVSTINVQSKRVGEMKEFFLSRNDLWMVRNGRLRISSAQFREERIEESGSVPLPPYDV